MDGYQLRTEKKKEKIRKAAIELFFEYGIDKVSLAEIAKKANVSPVTIYNHFGTKDELVKNVICSFLREEWVNRVETAKREDLSFPEKIEKMIFETSDLSRRMNPDFFNTLIMADPDMQKMLEQVYQEFIPYFIEFIGEGQRTGYIDSDVSIDSILVYFNILQNAMRDFEFNHDKDKNAKLAEDLSRLFFYGLLNKQPHK